MIDDGRAFGLTIAMQHLLRTLERKNILNYPETRAMLDGVLDELKNMSGALTPTASADAARAVGALYLPAGDPTDIE